MVGREGSGGIVCLQQIVLGGLDDVCEGKGVGELYVDSRMCEGDWMNGGKGREWGNCVLTAECVRVIGRICGKGREWSNCVLTAECVRVIGRICGKGSDRGFWC